MPDSFTPDELPNLTDQDVAILYDIVSVAQQSHDLPFRALFDARETVLAQHGASVEHNSKYLRFLLHVGDELTKEGTAALVTRFRALLSRLGIQLVFGEGEGIVEDSQEFDDAAHVKSAHVQGYSRGFATRRRVSFNDSNLDTTWISRGAADAQKDTVLDDKPRRRRNQDHADRAPVRQARSASLQRASRRQQVRVDQCSLRPSSDLEDAPRPHYEVEPYAQVQPAIHYTRAQKTALAMDAVAFQMQHEARRSLYVWHARASQLQQSSSELWMTARNHDRRVLLKQAFAQMQDSYADRRFWSQQERRAGRARDLFLLTKAFTHWAQSASDEVFRTSLARRHILRTKYFNAWKDITAINELKCRRLGLRKWTSVWRAKTASRQQDMRNAEMIYDENLVKQMYWKLFWTFCQRKAPLWKDARVEQTAFKRLVHVYRARRNLTQLAEHMDKARSARIGIRHVVRRGRALLAQDDAARSFRQQVLLRGCFDEWRLQSRTKPIVQHLDNASRQSLVSRVFQIWLTQTRSGQHARNVDRQRLLQDAWTSWNDQLRVRTLSAKIDDRVATQSLYRWVLEERCLLFQRVMNHRLRVRVLQTLSSALSSLQFRLVEALSLYEEGGRRRLMQTAMLRLHGNSRRTEHLERLASEACAERDLRKAMSVWSDKTKHLMQLGRWAADARFYCLTTSSLAKWKTSTNESKKAKKREAYAAIRQRIKLRLARDCLNTWRQGSARYSELSDRAVGTYTSRLLVTGTAIFDRWRDIALQHQEQSRQADAIIRRRLLADATDRLVVRIRETLRDERRAEALRNDIVYKAGSKSVKKLGDLLFVLRRQEETAVAWRDRQFGKHRREMLRYWAYAAAERRGLQGVGDPESPTRRPQSLFDSLYQVSAQKATSVAIGEDERGMRLDDLTAIDIGYDFRPNTAPPGIQHIATPLPGYMRTPSKRTARTRARFKAIAEQDLTETAADDSQFMFGSSVMASTTPAPLTTGQIRGLETLTPQVTPFQRKMRAGGYRESRTPMTGGNSRFGDSRFGRTPVVGDTSRTVRFQDPGIGDVSGFGVGEDAGPSFQ